MKIKILYEDKDILVIDKPSGISVHPDGRTKPACADREKTLTDWVLKNYPKLKGVGEPLKILRTSEETQNFSSCALPRVQGGTLGDKNFEFIPRPGIVHRLDKETSGVLIIVKNKKAFACFKEQFMNREIKKVYNAIVSGWVKNDRGIINKSIGRSPNDFRKRLAGRGARGELREAVTEYRVLKRFEVKAKDCSFFYARGSQPVLGEGRSVKKNHNPLLKFTYLEVRPKTGRTHQIRVHMKYLNHPVACDPLYNTGNPCPKDIKRLALHAKSIEFNLPAQTGSLKGEIIKVESPLPKEFNLN